MRYTGLYFGAEYVGHVYEPQKATTEHLLIKFKHKYNIDDNVICRKYHRKTTGGIIQKKAYSSEGFCGGKRRGGTVKVYMINGTWYYESEIKRLK